MNKPNISLMPKSHPLIASLPEYLKNPANYQEIQKKIVDSIMTTCSHGEMSEFAKCPKCTKKMIARRKLLKELGFKNPMQYMMWQKVHAEILKRYPLVDWKKLNAERLIEDLKKK